MRGLVIALVAIAAVGCAKKSSSPAPVPSSATAVAVTEETEPRERHSRVKDAAVYVDGVIVGFLKFRELPLGFQPVHVRNGHETEFSVPQYLTALGLDASKTKGVHFHGSRVCMVSGEDLRAGGDDIRFSFAGDAGGKPRPRFANGVRHKITLNTTIDLISAVAIYVNREPPRENAAYELVYPDGQPVSGMPYADVEAGAGTRVYVDGKLKSIVKRKELGNDLLANDDMGKPRFSLEAYLVAAGVDVGAAKAVDFISNDQPVAHFSRGADLRGLTFAVPARNQGLAVMDVEGESLRITAIQLYEHRSPPRVNAGTSKDSTRAPNAASAGKG